MKVSSTLSAKSAAFTRRTIRRPDSTQIGSSGRTHYSGAWRTECRQVPCPLDGPPVNRRGEPRVSQLKNPGPKLMSRRLINRSLTLLLNGCYCCTGLFNTWPKLVGVFKNARFLYISRMRTLARGGGLNLMTMLHVTYGYAWVRKSDDGARNLEVQFRLLADLVNRHNLVFFDIATHLILRGRGQRTSPAATIQVQDQLGVWASQVLLPTALRSRTNPRVRTIRHYFGGKTYRWLCRTLRHNCRYSAFHETHSQYPA